MQFPIIVLLVCVSLNVASSMGHARASSMLSLRNMGSSNSIKVNEEDSNRNFLAAVLPGAGGPVTGTLTVGVINGISLYSNILLARFALSWFPQLLRQFPVLRPIITVTDPYLGTFRKVIPPIGGFDLSALPAIFILDIASQTAAAMGCDEFPQLPKSIQKMIDSKSFKISASVDKN